MSDNSAIEWCDATWNPVRGCTKVSAGCKNCYAETFSERWRGVPGHPFEQGFDLRLVPDALAKPLGWRKARRIFVNSMSDLFHEDVPNEYIAAVFGVMAACPRHTFQVLTKRAERMAKWFEWIRYQYGEMRYTPAEGCRHEAMERIEHRKSDGAALPGPTQALFGYDTRWPLPNVWLGVSTENQETADERIPHLLATPAAVRFVSAEPLLGPVDLFGRDEDGGFGPGWHLKSVKNRIDYGTGVEYDVDAQIGLDWVIVGGESGPGARPFDVAWARSIVGQCRAAGVACFVKQLGASPATDVRLMPAGAPIVASWTSIGLKSRKGGDPAEWPEDLRVREFPAPTNQDQGRT